MADQGRKRYSFKIAVTEKDGEEIFSALSYSQMHYEDIVICEHVLHDFLEPICEALESLGVQGIMQKADIPEDKRKLALDAIGNIKKGRASARR